MTVDIESAMMTSRRNLDDNHQPFSDAVIRSVLPRTATHRFVATKSNSRIFDPNVSQTAQRPIQNSSPPRVILPPLRNISSLVGLATRNTEVSDECEHRSKAARHHSDAVAAPFAPLDRSNVEALSSPPHYASVRAHDSPAQSVSAQVETLLINCPKDRTPVQKRKRKVSVKSKACREQCRSNQARYRQKQREYVTTLKATVAQLRSEIPMLEVQRRRLRYDSQQRVWGVVAEYFQLFRHGVGYAFNQESINSSDVLHSSKSQQQIMFLRSTMAPDVEFGNASGVEALVGHWQRLSDSHSDLHLHLQDMRKVSESIVTATATLSVTISKSTLECVFPRLMRSEIVEDLSLAVKLLDHQFKYPCSVHFFWDEETSLVRRMEFDIDVVTPLLEHLGNYTDVSRVLEGAVMAFKGHVNEPLRR